MAKIGNFGKTIVFSTNDVKILTFSEFKQTISGRWTTHELILKKAKSEFLGPDLRSISFKITLSALHGIKPRKTMEKIEQLVEMGIAESLVIGGKKVGKNKWKITSMSEAWDTILNKGELVEASLNLTLEEYL